MKIKRFKLIYLPEGTSKKREFNLRREQLLIGLVGLLLVFLLLSGSTAYLLNNWFNAKKLSALTLKNSKLEKQLSIAREKLTALSQKIDQLAQSNGELRAYAHLPSLSEDILKVGIGGSMPGNPAVHTGAEDLLARLDVIERRISLQENSLVEVEAQLEDQEELLQSIPSIRPVRGGAYSSFFGRRRDPFTGQWEPHMGVDINTITGTPVYAAADGRVIHASREPAYGNVVVIDHGHGYRTLYAHLSRFRVVKGQKVKRGDYIAEVGNTGRSTGPHLHYEVIRNNQNLDPLDFMFEGYELARLP
jgi:murein DD-endopeptidase MepM/ murein hydrolase activator NlpD